jgi:hypothetical protein
MATAQDSAQGVAGQETPKIHNVPIGLTGTGTRKKGL